MTDKPDFPLNWKDVRVDSYRDGSVYWHGHKRLTHIPTGIVVEVETAWNDAGASVRAMHELTERVLAHKGVVNLTPNRPPERRMDQDLWAGHHFWCNHAGGRLASECSLCKSLNERFPMDGRLPDEMMADYFPDAEIVRSPTTHT